MPEAIFTGINPDRIEIQTALEAKKSRHFSCPEEIHSILRVLCQAQSEKGLTVVGCLPVYFLRKNTLAPFRPRQQTRLLAMG